MFLLALPSHCKVEWLKRWSLMKVTTASSCCAVGPSFGVITLPARPVKLSTQVRIMVGSVSWGCLMYTHWSCMVDISVDVGGLRSLEALSLASWHSTHQEEGMWVVIAGWCWGWGLGRKLTLGSPPFCSKLIFGSCLQDRLQVVLCHLMFAYDFVKIKAWRRLVS